MPPYPYSRGKHSWLATTDQCRFASQRGHGTATGPRVTTAASCNAGAVVAKTLQRGASSRRCNRDARERRQVRQRDALRVHGGRRRGCHAPRPLLLLGPSFRYGSLARVAFDGVAVFGALDGVAVFWALDGVAVFGALFLSRWLAVRHAPPSCIHDRRRQFCARCPRCNYACGIYRPLHASCLQAVHACSAAACWHC